MSIIDWIPEPQLWDREKIEQDNNEYNKPLDKPLEETKDELRSLFWDFNNSNENPDVLDQINEKESTVEWWNDIWVAWIQEWDNYISWEEMHEDLMKNQLTEDQVINENIAWVDHMEWTWTEEEYQEKLNNDKIKKTNEYPLVKNYLEENNINSNNLSLNEEWKIDINTIDWLNSEDKEMLNWLLVNLEWDNKMQNISNLWDIIKDISEFDEFNKEMWDNWFDDWVLNIIWSNYIDIPWKDWNIDKQKNLSVAIEMWKNEILNKVKNIKIDSQTYKTAIVNIDSWNLKKQLEWINSLYYLAFSSEWKLWAKDSLKLYKGKRKKELISDANILEQKIQLALKNNNTDEFKKLDKQKDVIINEADELNVWEVFESWKIDKISDEPKEWLKETN